MLEMCTKLSENIWIACIDIKIILYALYSVQKMLHSLDKSRNSLLPFNWKFLCLASDLKFVLKKSLEGRLS